MKHNTNCRPGSLNRRMILGVLICATLMFVGPAFAVDPHHFHHAVHTPPAHDHIVVVDLHHHHITGTGTGTTMGTGTGTTMGAGMGTTMNAMTDLQTQTSGVGGKLSMRSGAGGPGSRMGAARH